MCIFFSWSNLSSRHDWPSDHFKPNLSSRPDWPSDHFKPNLTTCSNRVYLASTSPPVRFPNVYGVNMAPKAEFVASGRTEDEVGSEWKDGTLVSRTVTGKVLSKDKTFPLGCHAVARVLSADGIGSADEWDQLSLIITPLWNGTVGLPAAGGRRHDVPDHGRPRGSGTRPQRCHWCLWCILLRWYLLHRCVCAPMVFTAQVCAPMQQANLIDCMHDQTGILDEQEGFRSRMPWDRLFFATGDVEDALHSVSESTWAVESLDD